MKTMKKVNPFDRGNWAAAGVTPPWGKKGSGSKGDSKREPLVATNSITPALDDFFKDVKRIERTIADLKAKVKKLESEHGSNLTSITVEQRRASQMRVDKLTGEANALMSEVRQSLRAIDETNQKLDAGSSELRLRQNVRGKLTRVAVEAVERFQSVQTEAKQQYRSRAERQFRAVHPSASAAQIDAALQGSADGELDVFMQQAVGANRAAAQRALTELQLQHRQIRDLEASITELHQLFVEMSVLVEAQGEQLDRIEFTMQEAVSQTDQAVDAIKGASDYQRRTRKKRLILLVIGIIIVVVIVVAVAV